MLAKKTRQLNQPTQRFDLEKLRESNAACTFKQQQVVNSHHSPDEWMDG